MRITFLTQRLPYAPNRGDRIRAYHELRALASRHDVHVVSLVHDEEERSHAADLRSIAASVRVARVSRVRNLSRALPALAGSTPLTHVLLDSPEIRPALAEHVAADRPDLVLAFCSSMVRFAMAPPLDAVPLILDMVDVDSAKWAALAERASVPRRWIYAREARVLGAFEARAARAARATFVVNEREAALLRSLAGADARVEVLENGVDVEALRPPEPASASTDVVFCGVMSYEPNVEAAEWLVNRVWPLVRKGRPDARLLLVGANPARRVRRLADEARSVVVTGSVPDVRPYLWHAAVSVAPILVARGVQTKVLEAIAAGLPTAVTPAVAEGLPGELMPAVMVAASPEEFAREVLAALTLSPAERRSRAGCARLEELAWNRRLQPLLDVVTSCPGTASRTGGSTAA